jgi:tetratricopeptide (TPR) repeat protein
VSTAPPPESTAAGELLRKAARCYARAEWLGDASRLFLLLHDDQSAAPFLEQEGRNREAAACYARSGNWGAAARCHLRTGDYDHAAEALYHAGERLRAAWIWAHQANRPTRAERVLNEMAAEPNPDDAVIELVRCRCDAAAGRRREGARRFRPLLPGLLQPGHLPRHLDWMLEVAQALARPDLAALVYSAANRAGVPDACRRWRGWAEQALGDIAGIPVATPEPQPPTPVSSQLQGAPHHG